MSPPTGAEHPNPNAEQAISRADPALGRVIRAVVTKIGRQRITISRASPFEALVRAVVYQSIASKAAATIFRRLKETSGSSLTPRSVLATPSTALLATGLSGSKSRAISSLAKWFADHPGKARALSHLPDDEIVATLTSISGIGVWTANVFLIFGLGRADVMPADDRGIRRGVQLVCGLKAAATPKQVQQRAQRWRPYRSLASAYLWNAVKLKITANDLKQRKQS
jgi:DNA-3-methyladenine glycosylase II